MGRCSRISLILRLFEDWFVSSSFEAICRPHAACSTWHVRRIAIDLRERPQTLYCLFVQPSARKYTNNSFLHWSDVAGWGDENRLYLVEARICICSSYASEGQRIVCCWSNLEHRQKTFASNRKYRFSWDFGDWWYVYWFKGRQWANLCIDWSIQAAVD